MTNFDWKSALQTIAPTIATALGGPLAGVAVKTLGKAILGNENASENDVEQAVLTGLPPDTIVRLKEIDNNFSLELQRIALQNKQEDYKNDKEYLLDTQDARHTNASNPDVLWIGIAILTIFGIILGVSMVGCWMVLTGGLAIADPATVGLVMGFLGTILGYVASNAQQVVSFWFGTSKGSKDKTDAMVNAFSKIPAK